MNIVHVPDSSLIFMLAQHQSERFKLSALHLMSVVYKYFYYAARPDTDYCYSYSS